MTRKDFIIALNGLALTFPFFNGSQKTVVLKENSTHAVNSNTRLLLPKNPREGQFVRLVVPSESVLEPSEIVFEHSPILSDHENLTLDTFGIFKIKFHGAQKGWLLQS